MTYAVNGKQFVAAAAGNTLFVFAVRQTPPRGLIAFISKPGDGGDLEVMNPDGTNRRTVKTAKDFGGYMAWVEWPPDCSRVVFKNDRGGTGHATGTAIEQIWTMKVDGTDAQQLTMELSLHDHPSWSPDGRPIAFAGAGSDALTAQLFVMNANGTGIKAITDWPTRPNTPNLGPRDLRVDRHPRWSPDGRQLVFHSNRHGFGNSQIYVINADVTAAVRITSTGGADPEFSPDGRWIAYMSGESGTNQVHIIRTDGTGGRQLTFPPLRPGGAGPSWSPDGTQIMFSDFDSTRPIQWQGYIMDANGSDVHKLPTGGGSYGPRWCAPKKM